MVRRAYVNAVAGAVPDQDIHAPFVAWAQGQIADRRERALFDRMADRCGIRHRWSILPYATGGGPPVEPGGFYHGPSPSTARRMEIYAEEAPRLALAAVAALREKTEVDGITHLVVASCTGFVAPGVDQLIARALGLGDVERTLVGFMGCYAAVAALKVAHHIVRSERKARVLVINVELCSLHLQKITALESFLAALQFGDGAAAALVTSEAEGFGITAPFALSLPDSGELIRWTIGDTGFDMHLSGEVPGRIAAALHDEAAKRTVLNGWPAETVDMWAVHAGGRSILDAVERSLSLPQGALYASRDVLDRFGNMSSATLMFVLAELLAQPTGDKGVAIAFGPGLAAEGFRFERAG